MKQISLKGLPLFLIMIGVTAIFFGLMPGRFLAPVNLESMASQLPEFGFLAIAMMLAMITGGIDLSIVAVANLTGVVAAIILTSQSLSAAMPTAGVIALSVVAVIVISAMCGFVNGLLVAVLRVPAILATLGSQWLFLGLAVVITKGHSVSGLPDAFAVIGNGTLLGVPWSFLALLVFAALVSLLLNRTRLGFRMYSVGGNAQVSRFSGIDTNRVLVSTHVLASVMAGLASLIMISRANSMRPGYGDAYLLQAILVVVLGGTDPNGGSGKVSGLIMAIIILQVTQSGLNFLSFSPFFKKFTWGLALLVVMVLNYLLAKQGPRLLAIGRRKKARADP
jgi:simple sugar transport system permease protein